MYPLIEAATAHEHQDELIREAAREQLAESVLHHERWRVHVGDLLVRAGTRLAVGRRTCDPRVAA
jgi:hypothetical protein